MIDDNLDQLWTSLPAMVVPGSFNGTKQTVHLYSGINGEQVSYDDQGNPMYVPVKMTTLPDVPIHYPAWGGYTMTGPIADWDEGMVMFSTRCIDGWWQNGGQQPRLSRRRHSLSDGYFVPGLKSQPNKLSPVPSTTGVEIRSNDGTVTLNFSKTGGLLWTAPGGKILFDVNGNVFATGNITGGWNTGDSVTLQNHTHAQGNDSHGDSEVETNKPTAGH
jgi:hypothetical protein